MRPRGAKLQQTAGRRALQAYHIPDISVSMTVCKSNMPPRTPVRAPGELQVSYLPGVP
jgi:CO/xanthine dehydrogenase Mo-binding subunit